MSQAPQSLQDSVDNSKAEYKRLGRSGLKVSIPIYGSEVCSTLPLLKAAYDKGLSTWDTANVYSNGVSEEIIGKAMRKYNIPRQKLVILSKCFGPVGEEPNVRGIFHPDLIQKSKDYVNQSGLSRQAIFNAVDASLQRIGTDYLDLLQIHRFDKDTPIEETMEALHDLVKAGKWAPLFRGHLARPLEAQGTTTRSEGEKSSPMYRELSEADRTIIKRVQELAEKKKWKMSHVALAWINKRIASPIIGFSSVERIDESLDMRGKELTPEEEKYLEEPYIPKNIVGHS
ncbi:MAG: hypothetical protein Q9160_000138 [Pyrenula sp. 1 TL-2023]